MLELIETMFAAGNFPEGFREGVNLRGFNAGRARQPMAPTEMKHFLNIRSKLACLLADCGFDEAAAHCESQSCGQAALLRLSQVWISWMSRPSCAKSSAS